MSTPAAKKRRWVSDVPVCPIYKATEPQCIFCDTEICSSIRLSFPDKQSRVDYMKRRCESDYQHCDIYMAFTKES